MNFKGKLFVGVTTAKAYCSVKNYLFMSYTQSQVITRDVPATSQPLLAVLQLRSACVRVLLAEDVEESRVNFVREVAGLQAAALLVEGEPGALLV